MSRRQHAQLRRIAEGWGVDVSAVAHEALAETLHRWTDGRARGLLGVAARVVLGAQASGRPVRSGHDGHGCTLELHDKLGGLGPRPPESECRR